MKAYPPRGYFVCECHDLGCHEYTGISDEQYEKFTAEYLILSKTCEGLDRYEPHVIECGYEFVLVPIKEAKNVRT